MSSDPVILVCGFGRCGSSLVMQMLYKAGVPVTGEWPGFERHLPTAYAPGTQTILSLRPGAAYKLLNVHSDDLILPSRTYKAIWLDRKPREQKKSLEKVAKVATENGWALTVPKDFRKRLMQVRHKAISRLQGLTKGDLLILEFEQIIEQPLIAAGKIAAHLDLDEVHKMADVVQPRETNALPDMSLEITLRG